MPRCAREISLTGYYHVFDRGNSKQIIFGSSVVSVGEIPVYPQVDAGKFCI